MDAEFWKYNPKYLSYEGLKTELWYLNLEIKRIFQVQSFQTYSILRRDVCWSSNLLWSGCCSLFSLYIFPMTAIMTWKVILVHLEQLSRNCKIWINTAPVRKFEVAQAKRQFQSSCSIHWPRYTSKIVLIYFQYDCLCNHYVVFLIDYSLYLNLRSFRSLIKINCNVINNYQRIWHGPSISAQMKMI